MANICGNYLQVVTKDTLENQVEALVSAWRGLPRTVGLLVHIPNKAVFNSPCNSVQNAWSFLS